MNSSLVFFSCRDLGPKNKICAKGLQSHETCTVFPIFTKKTFFNQNFDMNPMISSKVKISFPLEIWGVDFSQLGHKNLQGLKS